MPKKYYIWVLGCAMNRSDAERADALFKDLGYQKTLKENEADIILVMACSVRQSAIDRIFGKARAWGKKDRIYILSGCVLEKDKPKMTKLFDYFLKAEDLTKLPQILEKRKPKKLDFFSIKPFNSSSFSALVTIQTGCDNFCTYCAVPYTKGREKSRPFREIIQEVEDLVGRGYKEITLLGQNVNSYGKDLGGGESFVNLLNAVNAIEGNFWIRFLTSNPHDMTGEIIKTVANSEKITELIHLPIQAGSNRILKKMNRKYTREKYLSLIEMIRKEIPGVAITTDTIVGFPGETKKDFEETRKAYKKVGYDMAYIAQYSPRPGTLSAKFTDDVKKEEKIRREKELTNILSKSGFSNNQKYIGKEVEILVESHKMGSVQGRTRTYKLVRTKGTRSQIGKFIKVKITSVTSWAMEGIIKK